MKIKLSQYIKLGIFTLAGLVLLILLLYMIGSNKSMFEKTLLIKTRMNHVHGLVAGNNVRFAGINIGSVKEINIINDSTIEINMVIQKNMANIIKKNAQVSIGTEGFVGYKLINIENVNTPASFIQSGDILSTSRKLDTDVMIELLGHSVKNISASSELLTQILDKLNKSDALWTLMNDKTIRNKIHLSLNQINQLTRNLSSASDYINEISQDIKNQNGIIKTLVYDTLLPLDIKEAIGSVKSISQSIDTFEKNLSESVHQITYQVHHGKGPVPALFNDSTMRDDVHQGLRSLIQASDNLNQNMEALKHNFLFRGYFKKLEKQKKDSLKLKGK